MGWSQAWRAIKNPTGNSPDTVFQIQALGYQDKRTLSTYIYFDNKDNYLNPTRGVKVGLTVYSTGGWLGGHDHYMRYNPEFFWYFSPFHIPFLKTHPLVFEFRITGTFLGQPLGANLINQNYTQNEWLEYEDRLTIGGVETLRAWNYYDPSFPLSWRSIGLYHRILYGLEFRIPILPQMLWIALFFDAGSLWSDSFWETQMRAISPLMYEIIAADEATGSLRRIDQFFDTSFLAYFKYSYGIGIRVQIPMMPLRFWFGQKLIFQNNQFVNVPNGFNFQFAIGDMRF
jgi:outer membrane protein insertion porin family